MSCKCASFDLDEGWKCSISGDRCIYMFPDSKRCADDYGEGPDVEERQRVLVKDKIHEMYRHGYTIENIAENLGEDDCVRSFTKCPEWCHEDADCYNCWVKCLEKELEG